LPEAVERVETRMHPFPTEYAYFFDRVCILFRQSMHTFLKEYAYSRLLVLIVPENHSPEKVLVFFPSPFHLSYNTLANTQMW
jgi:hypothetical protein